MTKQPAQHALSSGSRSARWVMPDSAALDRLRDDVGDRDAVEQFATDFLSLLADRLDRLRALIRSERPDAAETLLLSLETSADMIGADGLARAAAEVRVALVPTPANRAGIAASLRRLRAESSRLLAAAAV